MVDSVRVGQEDEWSGKTNLLFNLIRHLLILRCTLGLVLGNGGSSTSDLLALVLGLLDGLSGLLLCCNNALSNQSVFGFKFNHRLLIVIDDTETSALATSKFRLEPKHNGKLGISLVHSRDEVAQL